MLMDPSSLRPVGSSGIVPNRTPQPPLNSAFGIYQEDSSKLLLERKYFDDKQSIKPWLKAQLAPKGINIVIERSDDSKIVFKCKYSPPHSKGPLRNSKSPVKAAKQKINCPFRIRANYSLRARRWSLVIVNDHHNHPLYTPPPFSEGSRKGREISNNSINSGHFPSLASPVDKAAFQARYNPANRLLAAAQVVTPDRQNQTYGKFQLPLPPNMGATMAATPLTKTDSSGSSSSSIISSPHMSFNDSNTSMATSTGSNKSESQLRLSQLQLQIYNMLLSLNASATLPDSLKEDAYQRVIGIFQETLISTNNTHGNHINRYQTNSPASGSNSPPRLLSLSYLYSNPTNNFDGAKVSNTGSTVNNVSVGTVNSGGKIVLPSLNDTIRSGSNSGTGINVNYGGYGQICM